jgi:hypothetical protein
MFAKKTIMDTKKKLILKRLGSVNNITRLEFAWTVNGEFFAYGTDYKPVSQNDFKNGHKDIKSIVFPQNKMQEIIMIDSKSDSDKRLLNILTSCPIIKSPESVKNGICKNPQYELIDPNEEIVRSVKGNKQDKEMMNFIDSLSIEDMCDILNYLGLSTVGLTAEEVYDKLINRKTGLAYDNYDKIMNMNKDFSSEMKININKALALGKIILRGGVYMFKENVLGSTKEQILAYFEGNKDLYNNGLIPELEGEQLPVSIGNELNSVKVASKLKDIAVGAEMLADDGKYTHEYNLKRAEELNIKAITNMKPETLKRKVMETEAYLAEKESARRAAKAIQG